MVAEEEAVNVEADATMTSTTVTLQGREILMARLDRDMPTSLVEGIVSANGGKTTQSDVFMTWESLIRAMAASVWAIVRNRGWSSDDLATQSASLRRPTLGHWLGLLRAGTCLLREHPQDQRGGLETLVEALDTEATSGPIAALFSALHSVQGLDLQGTNRTILGLLGAVVAYRNWTAHLGQGRTDVTPRMVPILAHALVEVALRVPPTGRARLLLITGRHAEEEHFYLETRELQGVFPSLRRVTVGIHEFESLREHDVYLETPSGQLLPMKPMMVASQKGDDWTVGWLQRVSGETVHAWTGQRNESSTLTVSVKPSDVDWLLGSSLSQTGVTSGDKDNSCPWPGMPAYGESDAARFHGRRDDIRRALDLLENHGCVVIHGISGAGKSSLVRAGLIPQLRSSASGPSEASAGRVPDRPFKVIEFGPGIETFAQFREAIQESLAPTEASAVEEWRARVVHTLPDVTSAAPSALPDRYALARLLDAASARYEIVLVADQLEQLWQGRGPHSLGTTRTVDTEKLREWALVLLTGAMEHAKRSGYQILLTIRVDMLDRPMRDGGFCRIQERCGLALGPLTRAGLEEVIRAPLRARSILPSAEFVDAVVTETLAARGGLSLLANLLDHLWFGRRQFTLDAYHAAGRLEGVIHRRAEEARHEAVGRDLSDQGRDGLNGAPTPPTSDASQDVGDRVHFRLFRQCVTVTSDGRYIRRWVALTDLSRILACSEGAIREYLEPYLRRRLVLLTPQVQDAGLAAPIGAQVAHDSLFTEWKWLREHLDKSAETLRLRDAVETAAKGFRARQGRGVWHDDDPRLAQSFAMLKAGDLELSREGMDFLLLSKRRARLERGIRWTAITALVLLAIGASVGAWQARSARLRAERARDQAEDLINLAMFGLRDRLAPVGRLDAMDYISARVDQYYRSVAREDGFEAAPDQRSVGGVLRRSEDRTAALRELRAGLDVLEPLARRDPSNVEWQRDLSLVHRWMGDVLRLQGDLTAALREYRASQALLEPFFPLRQNSPLLMTDVVVPLHRIALVLLAQGDARGAAVQLRRALAILQPLELAGGLTQQQRTWVTEINGLLAPLERD